jgi:hypothetical protein
LARTYTPLAIRRLAEIARDSENENAVVSACGVLLDRGWGKAPQAVTGEGGEGSIQVIVRHIIAGTREVPVPQAQSQLIEHDASLALPKQE